MSIELMLLAVNLNLVIFSIYLDDILGTTVCSIYINCCRNRVCNRFSYSCGLPQSTRDHICRKRDKSVNPQKITFLSLTFDHSKIAEIV